MRDAKIMKVCLFCSGRTTIAKKYLEEGCKLGYKIAQNNCSLVFGGGNNGLMGSVARGVKNYGGYVLGISPVWLKDFEELYPNCDKLIYTDSMSERKTKLISYADAFIIAPGGIGTLDELFEVLTLKELKKVDKKVVIYNFDNYYDKLLDLIDFFDKENFLKNGLRKYEVAYSIDEIFSILNGN